MTEVWRRDGEALGRVRRVPPSLLAETAAFGVHPALLDACFHVLGAAVPASGEGHASLLVGSDEFRLYAWPGAMGVEPHGAAPGR